VANGIPQGIDGAGGGFAQQLLKLGEDLFDGIEVGAVRRQNSELKVFTPRPFSFEPMLCEGYDTASEVCGWHYVEVRLFPRDGPKV
jgi:hypothetical protein